MVRSPQCNCPHAQGLFALLGKKWVLFILQAIDEGANTFTDIRRNIGEANTKILTDRLTELVELGILLKNTPDSKYSLSPLGKDLSNRLIDLAHWWGTRCQ
ncbi:helix-turn-helix transcriptional regulator [Candidatus Gracilibacteria bacterium]|nr:helix-turn-helix transcriptional regulator [Candidatus Gracilibacteria bacterium]